MDKEKKVQQRKLRKKAIRIQNMSPVKITMAQAITRAKGGENV